jgi:ribokinase
MVKESKIAIVGSNMIDLTMYLNRFPEKGETLFGRGFEQGFGGKGSNQATMASFLGSEVSMITCIGNDVYGDEWLERYEELDINTKYVQVLDTNHSGVASIWVEEDGDNRIILSSGANDDLSTEHVNNAFDNLPDQDVVLSQLENPQEAILTGFKRGKETGATTILNPAPADVLIEGLLDYTDWLVPNETEFALIAEEMFNISTDNFEAAIKEFADQTNTNIVVTMGQKGALLYMPERDMDVTNIETVSVEVKDTTGAGDAFCGTFAYGLSIDLEPEDAVKLANNLASDSVQRNGTSKSYAKGEALDEIVRSVLDI